MKACGLVSRSRIRVGKRRRIGAGCMFLDADFHGLGAGEGGHVGIAKPITIGSDLRPGRSVAILKGVHIGDDAVVRARCVVTRDILSGATAVGKPKQIAGSACQRDA